MTKIAMPEPVAEVCSDYALHWAGSGPIAPICERTGAKVGSHLITTAQAEAYKDACVREALERAAKVAMNAPTTADMLDSGDAKAVCFHASTRILMLLDKSTPARPESEQ